MIISLSGYAGSGKDQVAQFMQELQPDKNWVVKKWADKLREVVALLLNVPLAFTYTQEFKDMELPEIWNYRPLISTSTGDFIPSIKYKMTGRVFLQKLGTDAMREGLHDNTWVNSLISGYTELKERVLVGEENFLLGYLKTCSQCKSKFHGYKRQRRCAECNESTKLYPNWIITDTRFPNELEAVKRLGGITIRIERTGVGPVNNHPSEIAIDNAEYDYKIANVSDLASLKQSVEVVLNKIYDNNRTSAR